MSAFAGAANKSSTRESLMATCWRRRCTGADADADMHADSRRPRRWRPAQHGNQIKSFGTRLKAGSGGGKGCRRATGSGRTLCRDREATAAERACRVDVLGPTFASTAAVLTCSEIACTLSLQQDSRSDESGSSASTLGACVSVPLPSMTFATCSKSQAALAIGPNAVNTISTDTRAWRHVAARAI